MLIKVADSARLRATEMLHTVRSTLESPTFHRARSLPGRRFESRDLTNINVNNVQLNGYETSSIQTTSTSSSAHSGFLSFALPTTVNPSDPLPAPTCRLGAYQAEWLADAEGVWRLVTENATAAPVAQAGSSEEDVDDLKRINKKLRKQKQFLEMKISLLLDEVAKQIALVHQHEKILEALREQVKQKSISTPELLRSELRRELEEKLENTRTKQNLRRKIPTSDEDNADSIDKALTDSTILPTNDPLLGDFTTSQQAITQFERSNVQSGASHSSRSSTYTYSRANNSETFSESSSDLSADKQESKLRLTRYESKSRATGKVSRTGDRTDDSNSNISEARTATGSCTETDSTKSNTEVTRTVTNKESETDETDEEEELDDEGQSGEEEEEEESETAQQNNGNEGESEDASEAEDHEELSQTDTSQSESRLNSRRRVVQFGTVSRR